MCLVVMCYLHLHRLAVDELHTGHQVVEHDGALGAGVEHDPIDLSLHGERGVAATEHVHYVVHIGLFHQQLWIALLVLLPTRTHKYYECRYVT